MTMSENLDEDDKDEFVNYIKLQSAFFKLHNKWRDLSLAQEERDNYLKELIPINKELNKRLDERRAEGKINTTSKKILKDLKKKGITHIKMSENELISKLKDRSLTKEEKKLYIDQAFYRVAELNEKNRKYMKKKGKKRRGELNKLDLSPISKLFSRTRTVTTSGIVNLKEIKNLEIKCPICHEILEILKSDSERFDKIICRKCGSQKFN